MLQGAEGAIEALHVIDKRLLGIHVKRGPEFGSQGGDCHAFATELAFKIVKMMHGECRTWRVKADWSAGLSRPMDNSAA
jgi:hypothetical protein